MGLWEPATETATEKYQTLDGTATFEDILTGQPAANCTGTRTVKGVTDQALMVKAGDSHGIYLNVADGWAGADAGLKATGTIILEWVALS